VIAGVRLTTRRVRVSIDRNVATLVLSVTIFEPMRKQYCDCDSTATVFVVLARRKARALVLSRAFCVLIFLPLVPPPTTNLRKRATRPFPNGEQFPGNVHFLLLGSCGLVGAP
jgi:hypothetical protein